MITGNNSAAWRGQIINCINSTIRQGRDVTVYGADGDANDHAGYGGSGVPKFYETK